MSDGVSYFAQGTVAGKTGFATTGGMPWRMLRKAIHAINSSAGAALYCFVSFHFRDLLLQVLHSTVSTEGTTQRDIATRIKFQAHLAQFRRKVTLCQYRLAASLTLA
jgi:hypothetical protein